MPQPRAHTIRKQRVWSARTRAQTSNRGVKVELDHIRGLDFGNRRRLCQHRVMLEPSAERERLTTGDTDSRAGTIQQTQPTGTGVSGVFLRDNKRVVEVADPRRPGTGPS